MKCAFSNKLSLNRKNKERLNSVNKIIEEYLKQDYKLTLRQLYYQLVSRDIIPNSSKEYAKLSMLLVKGRMAGFVDWEAIEDRIRRPYIPYHVNGIKEALNDTINAYRLDRMKIQDNYIEIWCEKDALSGILKRITSYYGVRLMINRGYSSCSAMYDASLRMLDNSEKKCHIFYLGDHDPSGMDMVRDIRARMEEFGCAVNVEIIALTNEQIKKYNPPPNPAKRKDPRANEYISEHGATSWEVDALNPDVLHALVKNKIENLINMDDFNKMLKQENEDRETIRKMLK